MVTLKKMALSCAAVAAVAAATPAMADVNNTLVRYQDLDLSTPQGEARLQTRIKSAVRKVCRSPRAFTMAEKQDLARCQVNALAAATPKAERTIARYKDARRLAANETAIVGN